MLNNVGPKIEPWGTPDRVFVGLDLTDNLFVYNVYNVQ